MATTVVPSGRTSLLLHTTGQHPPV